MRLLKKFAEFLRTLILKNIYERLLLLALNSFMTEAVII